MNPYTKLAKQAVEHFVKTGKELPVPDNLPEKLIKNQAGVFVSLHLKDSGKLRGCIGTFRPTQKNVAKEIVQNAVAVTRDPRFPPLSKKELPRLTYKVDILSDPRPAKEKDLDPKNYGLIVTGALGQKGLLLPDIPGISSVEEQIEFCKQKAGLKPFEPAEFEIFTVKRYEE